MRTLNLNEIQNVNGGAWNFSGGGARGRYGSYWEITGGPTFNPTKNVSISPNITVTKLPTQRPKITGGGIGVTIRF
ncbi:hypothetical protein [Actinobacillus equuli]|uniref:hypothetical protein n=1 Tax=Actinobacillus equuli TaxID=718 RepID=UPI0024432CBD|nr:hypothetical protein [Actinobacillus equuli]WGE41428.1 hypothetical protein NYR64_06675 [Actinobacillus equuli subsp. haemolyticus]